MTKTILIVDDDFSILKLAKGILADEYKVITVNSGEQAFEYLAKKRPDLILLDMLMPGMSGTDVMKKLKEDEELAKIPVVFLTSDRSVQTEVMCFKDGAVEFIGKPFVAEVVKTRIKRLLELEGYKKNLESLIDEQTTKIVENQTKVMEMQDEVLKIQREVIASMASLIEGRDGDTGEHVKRTNQYVRLIAEALRKKGIYKDILNEQYIEHLSKASALHDIGKITTPDDILRKPGKLTEEEFEIMKKHAEEGGKIIKSTMSYIEENEYVDIAYDVAVYHHEKWNGKGYPEGLKETEIPLGARIMAVADVFDALTSERCYKKAVGINEAFEIIKDSAGTHFDKDIVDAFMELKPEVRKILGE